jgi:hypothetical protein
VDDKESGAGDEIGRFIFGADFSQGNEAPVDKSDRVKKVTSGMGSTTKWLQSNYYVLLQYNGYYTQFYLTNLSTILPICTETAANRYNYRNKFNKSNLSYPSFRYYVVDLPDDTEEIPVGDEVRVGTGECPNSYSRRLSECES